jgi:hypothetical protein
MGRWFGYRPRYADLCRLYTSPDLVKWYRHIATATAELREEFDMMIDRGGDPLQFGNRVRAHPDGLLITAANKMRASSRVRAGFSGTISETVSFDLASAEYNRKEFANFFDDLPNVSLEDGRYIWKGVEGSRIATLLGRVETSKESWKANSRALSDYVQNRIANGLLKDWTVVLISKRQARKDRIGEYEVNLTDRANRSEGEPGRYTIGRLVSPADEMIDLEHPQRAEALRETISAWEKKKPPKSDNEPDIPSGPFIRRQRDRTNGLLLVYPIDRGAGADPLMGFAVSFPFDDEAPLIDYAENSVKQLEDFFA